jgi:hypothetical protein
VGADHAVTVPRFVSGAGVKVLGETGAASLVEPARIIGTALHRARAYAADWRGPASRRPIGWMHAGGAFVPVAMI